MTEKMGDEEKANWHPGEEGLLTEDEAHDQANMLKAKAGSKQQGGNFAQAEDNFSWQNRDRIRPITVEEKERIRPITAEEYDEANKVIEELEATIADKTGFKKVLSKVKSGSWALLSIALDVPKVLYGGLENPTIEFNRVMSKETLNKAKAKLKEMKRQGESYGKENAKRQKSYTKGVEHY